MVARERPGTAVVFPGQASQRTGMARELLDGPAGGRDLFHQAGEVLGLDLAGVCTTGDDALLTRTDIAQPALLTTCLAWLAVVRGRGIEAEIVAGHSLGEFAAWVAAEAMDFETALRLVRRRGELMEDAADRNPGGMVAIIGLPDAEVVELCDKAKSVGRIVAANFNCPGQVVVSGEPPALDRVVELAGAVNAKAIPLRVSGAFHSPLMDDAAHEFAQLVSEAQIADPRIPVVANATAQPVTDAESVRVAMSQQMTSPVLWRASIHRMIAHGVGLFLEVGPGKILTGLIQRTSAEVSALAVGSMDQLDSLLEEVEA